MAATAGSQGCVMMSLTDSCHELASSDWRWTQHRLYSLPSLQLSDPLILTHLHQTLNTQTTAFNCECAPVCYLGTSLSTRKPMCVCVPSLPSPHPGFGVYVIFYVIFASGYQFGAQGLTWWPVINFYSSAACAVVLTAGSYVAGCLAHHKENHTLKLCESLTIHNGALQQMATKWCTSCHAFIYFSFYITEKIFYYITFSLKKNAAQRRLAGWLLGQK